jgi:2,3-bisphosphoglycerate-independent phosphoglycerate mutase
MKVIFIFIDGLGVTELNKNKNPVSYTSSDIFHSNISKLLRNGVLFPLDATMGTWGLPQSATGQTSLYTGINAQKLIGKHLTGYPNETLRIILHQRSLFVILKKNGLECLFLNAFRPVFFTSPELFSGKGLSASSEMNRAADLPFKTLQDVRDGKALYHDYTNKELMAKGFTIPEFSGQKAADIIIKQLKYYDFILYEYFLTDKAGHSLNMDKALNELKRVEILLQALIHTMDFRTTVLIAVSDHGNIEDMTIKTHTRHPAFMAVWGSDINVAFNSLIDVHPFVLDIMGVPSTSNI